MEVPAILWLLLAGGAAFAGVFGVRGWLDIHEALRLAELDRLAQPPHWLSARALAGVALGVPVVLLTRELGLVSLALGITAAASGYALAPWLLQGARRRVEQQVLDDLPLHLDLLAMALEAGCSWSAALVICTERAPEGALRRAWQRVILDIHSGMEPVDALRALEQRLRLSSFSTLVSALRAAEKLQVPVAAVLRERARQTAAARFARAERRARAAPLKLWAAMLLCLAPCTALVLAYPLARVLALWLG